MTRRRAGGALVVVVALVATACAGPISSHPLPKLPTPTTTPISPDVSVDTSATPAGWVPIDYGDAQLSVPANWQGTFDGCVASEAPGTIMVARPGPPLMVFGATPSCVPEKTTARENSPVVQVGPIAMAVSADHPPPLMIHGIAVEVAAQTACALSGPCPVWYVVPSLHVEIVDDETDHGAGSVIRTLTHSPRTVALAPGPVTVPPGWHRISFGGISASVPDQWTVQHSSNWASGCSPFPNVLLATGVTLDSGSTDIEPSCPAEGIGGQQIQAPGDGLVVDPGMYGPFHPSTTFGPCQEIHGLTVCPSLSDPYGFLVVAVHLVDHSHPVAIEIGLTGTGVKARTILHSLTVAQI
jgi:hypothetical protein